MAWAPRDRTSPVRRRDQNLALLSAIVSGMVLAVALVLLVLSRVDPALGATARGALLDVSAPLWRLLSVPVEGVTAAGSRIGDHFDTVADNRRLRERVAADAVVAVERDRLRADNRRLAVLLHLAEPMRPPVTAARFIAPAAGVAIRAGIITAGRAQGVAPGQVVRAPGGVVGRVTDTGRWSARVLLVSDSASRIPVRAERGGWVGLAEGDGVAGVRFRWDPPAGGRVAAGDRLVTTGDGGVFPPGLPVAVIGETQGDDAPAQPAVELAGLEAVLVERPWSPAPPAAPPAPTAATRR